MRVVGGSAKGRLLRAPKGQLTRPTSDRVREAIFSMVASRVDLDGLVVADLFAGSGAMGIEALSRGAAEALFVDETAAAVQTVKENLATAGFEGSVIRADVARHLRSASLRFDVVFADPPYAWDGWQELFDCLDTTLVVAESDRELDPGPAWQVLKVRRYGDTVVTLAMRQAR